MQTAGRHAPRRTCRRCREPPACPASRSCRTDQAEPQTAAPPRSCSVHSPDERWSMRRPACPRLPDSGRLRPSSKDRAAAGRGRWRPHSRKRSAMHAITISNIACQTRSRIAPTSFLPGERNTCSRKSHCRCCRGVHRLSQHGFAVARPLTPPPLKLINFAADDDLGSRSRSGRRR